MFGLVVVIFVFLFTPTMNWKLDEIVNNWIPINVSQQPTEKSVQTTEPLWKESQTTQNIDLLKQEAIRVVAPPAKTHKRKLITFYFSTPNINEDMDLFYNKRQEFNQSAYTTLFEEPSTTENVKFNSYDYFNTYYLPENSKTNSTDYADILELPKADGIHVTEKIQSTEIPVLNVTTTTQEADYTSRKFEPQLTEKENIKTNDVLKEAVSKTNQRKSKEINSQDFVNNTMELGDKVAKEQLNAAESQTQLISVNVKKYEVTEPTTTEVRTDTTSYYDKGYIYKQPIVIPLALAANRNALTLKLLNNLSKYNIKVDDVLNNYDDSKARKKIFGHTYNFPQRLMSMRQNSQNHLPTNPFLATLLSNYGYYLRGSFGRLNDYRNLYGYSASNNIHNNKPFGSYKLFSDTDSSN